MNEQGIYDRVAAIVNRPRTTVSAWLALADCAVKECGQASAPLRDLLLLADASALRDQLDRLFSAEPLPPQVNALYFGLFDAIDRNRSERALTGFYVCGASNYTPGDADAFSDPIYYPKGRYLASAVLDSVRNLSYSDQPHAHFYNYAVTLCAAALLARQAMSGLLPHLQLVAGFDEGDILDIARGAGA